MIADKLGGNKTDGVCSTSSILFSNQAINSKLESMSLSELLISFANVLYFEAGITASRICQRVCKSS